MIPVKGLIRMGLMAGLTVLVLLAGCSKRSWYASFQEMERQNCYEMTDRSAREKCLEKVNERSFDQYSQEREAVLKKEDKKTAPKL